MSFTITILIFNLLLLPSLAIAKKCIKDILAVSQSAESAIYENSTNSGNYDVSTEIATMSQFDWVIYCPEETIEIHPYLTYRYIEFSGDNKESNFTINDQQTSLLAFGVSGKTPINFKSIKLEFPFALEINQDIYLNLKNNSYRFEKYINTKFEIGVDAKLWNKNQHSMFGSVHLGSLIGLNSKAMFGSSYRLKSEYYYRWSSKVALSLGLQYHQKNQRINLIDLKYQALATNAQFVFRL
jgi:hypothetical protein